MPDITPLNGYVLLKRYVKPEKKTAILMLEATPKPQWLGFVEYSDNEEIICGNLVQYKQYSAVEVEGHPDYILVKEDDIIAILPMPEHVDAK